MEDLQKFTSAAMDSVLEKESDEPFIPKKLGVIMSTNPEIAQAILSGLSAVQVSRLLSTCRLWNSVGLKELRRRKNFHFISLSFDRVRDGETRDSKRLEMENKMRLWAQRWRSVPGFCLVLHDKRQKYSAACPAVEVFCDGGIISTEEVMAHRRYVYKNISFCESPECPNLAFSPNTTLLPKMANTDACTINNSQVAKVETLHGMKRPLADPEGCASPSVKVRRSAIINQSLDQTPVALDISMPQSSSSENSSDSDTSVVRSLYQEQFPILATRAQQEKASLNCALCRNVLRHNVGPSTAVSAWPDFPELTMMCFPDVPGVTFRPLKITKKQTNVNSSNSTEDLVTWHGCLKKEDRVRAVLFFEDLSVDSVPYVQQLIKREQGNVAVVGGKSFEWGYTKRQARKGILGMAVCGENVTAASVGISTAVEDVDMTSQAMSKFRKFYDPNKTSVAFFITCSERRHGRHEEDQIFINPAYEVKMFRKMYPTTPVFGAFVDAETCFEFLPHPPGSVEWQLQQEKNKEKLAMSTNSLSNVIQFSVSTCILFMQFE
ncbi:uncharacterized protein LOC108676002 isoform X2 [Hyalella azteca]|uniref:Uncharacterized protein LOC108676002 isoform X2 n=1 Tax=Hyalella azteca TaxID=294128 RepID=A0A8B7P0J4_HYAAZ|nr:uncharacterized protein LOC108676002 isoform X2 [Hyalella azteca]